MLRVGGARAQLFGRPCIASCAPPLPNPKFQGWACNFGDGRHMQDCLPFGRGWPVRSRSGNIKTEGGGEGRDILWKEGSQVMHA